MAESPRRHARRARNKIGALDKELEGIPSTRSEASFLERVLGEEFLCVGIPAESRALESDVVEECAVPTITELSQLEQLLEERLGSIEQKLDTVVRQLSSDSQSFPPSPRASRRDTGNGQQVRRDSPTHHRRSSRLLSGYGTSARFGLGLPTNAACKLHLADPKCSSVGDNAKGKVPDFARDTGLSIAIEEESDQPNRFDCRASDVSSHASAVCTISIKSASAASVSSLPISLRGDTGRQLSDRLWVFFQEPSSSRGAQVYNWALNTLIFLSILVPMTETLSIEAVPATAYFVISTVIDVLFLVELCVRWLVSPSPMSFLLNSNNMLDIAIVGPFALRIVAFTLWRESGTVPDVEANRIAESTLLCVVPVLRLVKALRDQRNFTLLVYTLHAVLEPLFVPLNMLAIMCIFFSCVLYVVEPRDNVLSMPHAMWLVIVTVSTVGYGDVSAVTDWGKLVTCVLIFFGCLCMAMPIGIVGTAFTETWRNRGRILIMKLIRERLRQWGYTDESLRSLFSRFDTDDGELSFEEFSTLIKSMKLGLTEGHIRGVFSIIDADNGGTIDIQEFIAAVDLGEVNPFYVF